ncbi:hypothetical protein [Sphingomonas sp.]|uniref:hypothetical protein n=1 Tax=Sphingomonas sp. TaxID=28214 RepID=UPI001B036D23|nr:hypothetical protein [Sphingomonas sp.]MBO9712090.1 hypothetical protein [Sphingomonas sp.]
MRAFALIGAVFALASSAASAQQRDGFVTSRTYIKQLQGRSSDASVTGPDRATLMNGADATKPGDSLAIADLRAFLPGCRSGAAGYGAVEGHPGRRGSWMNFECLDPAAPAKSMKLVVVVSADEHWIEAVDVHREAAMDWLPPSPTPPGWKPDAGADKLPTYRETGRSFLDAVAHNDPGLQARPVPIKLADLRVRKISDLSVARAGEILRSCTIVYGELSSFSVEEGVPPHEAVRFAMKCDTRSSAPSDLSVWTSFADGRVDGVGIRTENDYPIPPSAIGTEK